MFNKKILVNIFISVLVLVFTANAQAQNISDYRPIYKSMVEKHGNAIVTVKFVMAINSAGKEQRIEDRAQAVLVSSDGLLLVPDRAVSFDFSAMAGGKQGEAGMVAKSSEFRVRLVDSEDWLAADLVTRDSALGLAWLRIRNSPKNLPFVDLSLGGKPEPGMEFFTLLRTNDESGSVPIWRPGLIMGETHVPKLSFLVDGLPGLAFDTSGKPLGYVDVNLAAIGTARSAMGLDMANVNLQLTPIDKVAYATALASKLPVAAAAK
ncbi:MAG: hypothetical protein ABI644_07535 [Arenimonas sp.]